MNVQLTVMSQSGTLVRLVGDFARGLGCITTSTRGAASFESMVGSEDALLELLDYVALSSHQPAWTSVSRCAG